MEVFIVQLCNENIEGVFATPEEAQAYIDDVTEDGSDIGYDYEVWRVGEHS